MAEYIEREVLVVRLQEHRRLLADAWGDFGSMPIQDKARVDELSNCIAEVFNAPAADVAPVVHGRWIEENGVQICSNCGEEHSWEEYRATFCEDCGARMDGDGE